MTSVKKTYDKLQMDSLGFEPTEPGGVASPKVPRCLVLLPLIKQRLICTRIWKNQGQTPEFYSFNAFGIRISNTGFPLKSR